MKSFSLKTASTSVLLTPLLLFLAMPGGGEIWPLLPVALVPLFILLREEKPSRRLLLGCAAGSIHFLLQLYWIVIVLGRYGGLPWFFSVPALILLCCYMAFYFGLFLLLGGVIVRRWKLAGCIWLLPLLWVGLDWLRSMAFSGFPWMDLGYGFWHIPVLIQTADLVGHHGTTYLIVLCNCVIAAYVDKSRSVGLRYQTIAVAVVLGSVLLYGVVRTGQIGSKMAESDSAVFGVVQGNIDQSRKWSPDEQRRTVEKYLSRSDELTRDDPAPQVIVWPETALPFYPARSRLTGSLRLLAIERGVSLLTGSPWFERETGDQEEVRFYNAAFLVNSQGKIGRRYYKSHLVPFGEYVPLRKLLFFLAPLVEAVGDFSPGTIEKPLVAGKSRAGVLICFESIFPDIARKWSLAGANVLVNLTNDAWYGKSSAPRQSLAMTVFRAVETRRSLVRAANTGISGFIDPVGRVSASSDIFVDWSANREVALLDTLSFHSRYGYLFGPMSLLASLIIVLSASIRRRKRRLD